MTDAADPTRAPAGLRRTRRWLLWGSLVALIVALLVLLVWLAGRYETSQVQQRLERDTADALTDLRTGLTRNHQSLLALQASEPSPGSWRIEATSLLREHRELLQLEWRDVAQSLIASATTPYLEQPFGNDGELRSSADITLACASAKRYLSVAYSPSYFLPRIGGQGMELMEMCLPVLRAGRITGYVVATYSLPDVLANLIPPNLLKGRDISFVEADGTRLALVANGRRVGTRVFTASQLITLPGNTLILRIDGWRTAPDLFPNVLTALVTALSIALTSVLMLLVKDMRRRLAAERDLAEALAFRKAMEDSLITGLRARDLEGRITYVNPAFCNMVGYTAAELLGHSNPAPYWPPEYSDEYRRRQLNLLSGQLPRREGRESLFVRKDGQRIPVLIFEAPLINAQGRQTGWMSAFLDVSEQRRVEELSRASQERLQASARLATVGEMASLLSHELNQPLAAISSYATGSLNMLSDPQVDAHDIEGALRQIGVQAERAGKVIRSVHDFVRRRDRVREAISAKGLLDAIMPLVSLQAHKYAVGVQIDIPPGLPEVVCDVTMVEQVLLNLARNGIQAMAETEPVQRVLRFAVRRRQDEEHAPGHAWMVFQVIDAGSGIAPEVAQRLFTPFFTTRTEGMGLGLSLCRTVVEEHGGFLSHENASGRGTIFTFTLPLTVTT